MTKGKVVFAGTFRVESISVPVQLIRSGRKTIGVKVDQKGVVTAQAPYLAKEADILAFLSQHADRIEQYVAKSRVTPGSRRMPDGLLRRSWSIWHSRQCR